SSRSPTGAVALHDGVVAIPRAPSLAREGGRRARARRAEGPRGREVDQSLLQAEAARSIRLGPNATRARTGPVGEVHRVLPARRRGRARDPQTSRIAPDA